jgi:hypothetical protein
MPRPAIDARVARSSLAAGLFSNAGRHMPEGTADPSPRAVGNALPEAGRHWCGAVDTPAFSR